MSASLMRFMYRDRGATLKVGEDGGGGEGGGEGWEG